MVIAKLVFLIIMGVCGVIAFITPFFFPEAKYKNDNARRIRAIVRIRLACLLIILILMLLCLILR